MASDAVTTIIAALDGNDKNNRIFASYRQISWL
jgi:hypothetical protein